LEGNGEEERKRKETRIKIMDKMKGHQRAAQCQ
jgi:hypothetical protein